jgi:hypothetical protein
MLVGHLLFAIFIGAIAATGGVLLGFSGWAATVCFVLGANLWIVIGAVVAHLDPSVRTRSTAWSPAYRGSQDAASSEDQHHLA